MHVRPKKNILKLNNAKLFFSISPDPESISTSQLKSMAHSLVHPHGFLRRQLTLVDNPRYMGLRDLHQSPARVHRQWTLVESTWVFTPPAPSADTCRIHMRQLLQPDGTSALNVHGPVAQSPSLIPEQFFLRQSSKAYTKQLLHDH